MLAVKIGNQSNIQIFATAPFPVCLISGTVNQRSLPAVKTLCVHLLTILQGDAATGSVHNDTD